MRPAQRGTRHFRRQPVAAGAGAGSAERGLCLPDELLSLRARSSKSQLAEILTEVLVFF